MALFVASPTGEMNATGTGTIESQQHTAASHTAITHEFRVNVPVAGALFAAISWADVNTEGNVDASSGQTDFTVSMDQAAFAAALKTVIENALGGKASATFSLSTNASGVSTPATLAGDPSNLNGGSRIAETVLDREVRLEVEAALNRNGVLEYLEGDSLGEFALALDASGGAADMASKLPSNSAALRNLFLQIPNRTSGGVAVTDESGSRLPVQAGDEIAFIFNVAPSVTITQVAETADAAAPAAGAAANDLTETSMPVDGIAILTTETRKIAFIVQVVA
jgi:hypothetical protein